MGGVGEALARGDEGNQVSITIYHPDSATPGLLKLRFLIGTMPRQRSREFGIAPEESIWLGVVWTYYSTEYYNTDRLDGAPIRPTLENMLLPQCGDIWCHYSTVNH